MSRVDVAARALAEQFDLITSPVDPEKIAREMGATVVHQAGESEINGMLLRRDGQIVIGLNPEHPPTSQRLALAHLIGHLKLHASRDLILDTAARHTYGNLTCLPTDREEAEANRFAVALLAPEALVREAAAGATFGTARELVEILADRFEMGPTAMGYWLMALGIIMDI